MDTESILKNYPPKKEYLLQILHGIQDNDPRNYLSEDSLKLTASYLNLSLGQVYGVAGYYSMFSTKPRGKYIVRLCNSPVCHLSGSENAIAWAKELLAIDLGETSSDGLFSLEESECLGRCGKAPSMMVNREFYGELTKLGLEQIFSNLRDGMRKP